jgi:hypothetical protein
MTKMTHRTNLIVIVKLVDLDTSCIYSHNHMVGMDKIFFSEIRPKTSITYWIGNHLSSFKAMLYFHLINDGIIHCSFV